METYHIGPGIGEAPYIFLRINYHQVDIQRLAGDLRYGFDHRKSETDVRHEDTVHHVQMEDVGIGVDHFDIPAKRQKIG